MPDLERLLDEFDPRSSAVPPSAAEIRRRGDRLRRRNRALAVVGSALAVAVIATPLAFLTRGDDSTAPPAPADDPVRTVDADDLPLALELPRTNADGSPVTVTDQASITELEVCGAVAWTPETADDVAGTTYTHRPGATAARTLAVYPDATAARGALDRIRAALGEGCTTDTVRYEPWDSSASGLGYWRISEDPPGRPVRVLVEVERFEDALYLDTSDARIPGFRVVDDRLLDALGTFEGVVPRFEGELVRYASLAAGAIPGPRDLPDDEVTRLGRWEAVEIGDDPVDPCRPEVSLDGLGPSTRYRSQYVAGSDSANQAVLGIAMLEFEDPAAAREADALVESWVGDDCAGAGDALDGTPSSVGYAVPIDDGTVRYHRRASGTDGAFLALVSYSVVHDGAEPAWLEDSALRVRDESLSYDLAFEPFPDQSARLYEN